MRLTLFYFFIFFIPVTFVNQDNKILILGNWESDTIENVNVKFTFLEKNNGFAKWSTGKTNLFKYSIKDNILKMKVGKYSASHKIHHLDNETLIFKPIKKNQETIALFDEFIFKKVK